MKTRKMAAAAAQQQACRYRGNICKILSGDNHLQFCDKHYKFHTDFLRNNPSILKKNQLDLLGSETPDLTKKKKVKKQSSILPPDEERCCRIGGGRWRCKNFRMKSSSGTKNYCEEHCRSISQHNKDRLMKKKKKKSEAGLSKRVTETRDSNRIKRPAKRQLTGQPSTSNPTTSSDAIVGAGSVKIGAKRKRVERMSGELESLTGIRGPVVETRASKRRKMVMEGDETSNQPAINDNFESDGIVEGGPPKIGTKRKNVERTKGSGEPAIELESAELYKSNCFELSMELEKNKVELEKIKVELEKNKVELEKKKVECTELQGKLAEVEETTKSTAKDENATEFWRKRCSDLESLVQRMENENSTMTCVESRVSNLGSLAAWNGKESSIVRCQELSCSEKIESEVRGLQNEITKTGEKQRDENNMSEPTTSSDRITEGASPNVWTKMKNVESTKGSGEPVNDQLESVELYQSNCIELFMEPEKNELELEKVKAELEKNEVELEKNVRSTKGSGEPVNDQLQSVELYQSNCIELFMEPEKNEVELEKVKAELEKNEVELLKNVESTKGSGEPVNDQLESVELYQSNCIELSMEPEKNKVELEKVKVELEKNEVEHEKNVESTKGSGQPVNDQLESMELYKSNCFELSTEPEKNKVELEKVKAELEKNEVELPKNELEREKNKVELEKNKVDLEKMKKKVECTEFQDKLAEVEETRKSISTDENTTEFWRMECSDAEILVQRLENENSTIGCVETCISNLASLVPGNGKESSLLGCQELSYSEKVESEARGLQNEITQTGEKPRDMSKPNAETRGEGSKDSCAYELKTEEKVLNVEEGKDWGCLEERSSSQADLGMCNKISVNLVSDSNDGGDSLGTEDSLGDSMDMIVPGNGNESLILRCQELSYSDKVESEAQGLQNEITQTGENQGDKDMSKPNAETVGEGSKDSRAYELKSEEKVLNVEEGKGWGCSEERPSQHGSSSQADLEMCNKTSLNLVFDSNDGGDSLGAEDSLGDSMDMIVPGNGNVSSILRCQELSCSEKVESEAPGLQNEITQTGENQRDKDMSKPNAETIGEGSKDSRAYELNTEEKVLNVIEGKGCGCLEERPSEHGSSSQADLEMCKKTSVNLVSDSNDGGDSLGAEDSLGDSMDMIVSGNGNESSEKVESEAQGLQNEITQTGENQRDKDMSKPNAETIGEGSKDSLAYELKTGEKVLNVEEGKGWGPWGCLEERPSQHGSSSQADLEMCKNFLNLVSDSNDGCDSLGAEDSLGDSMDMLAMKNLNMNKDKLTEADMLSSVEDCMKAVGALYQQEISKD